MELMEIIAALRPNVEFVLRGDDIENIEYHTGNVTPVTRAEIDAQRIAMLKAAKDKTASDAAATAAAIAHAKNLGFTDAMIAVMYPNLLTGAEPLVGSRESLNIPAKIDNNVTLDTVTP